MNSFPYVGGSSIPEDFFIILPTFIAVFFAWTYDNWRAQTGKSPINTRGWVIGIGFSLALISIFLRLY